MVRELGSKRRETVWSLSAVGVGNLRGAAPNTRGPYDAASHVYNSAKTLPGTNSVAKGVAWWKEIVGYDKSVKPDTYIVGEIWEATSTRAEYMAGLGSTFHFDMGTKIIDEVRSGNAYSDRKSVV